MGHKAHNSVQAHADGQTTHKKLEEACCLSTPDSPLYSVGNPSLRFPTEFLLATGDFPFVSLESEWKRECYSFHLEF